MHGTRFIIPLVRFITALIVAAAGLGTMHRSVQAADITFQVDTLLDSNAPAYQACTTAPDDCSLRGAISKVRADTANGHILVLQAQTYVLSLTGGNEDSNASGDLDIMLNGQDLTIQGGGATINADGIDRVLNILGSGNVTLTDLTITGGHASDGISGGSPGNSGQPGGGIYTNINILTLDHCVVDSNHAGNGVPGLPGPFAGAGSPGGQGGMGGGIYFSGSTGTLILRFTRVVNNHGGDGGMGGPGGPGDGVSINGGPGGSGGQGGPGGGIVVYGSLLMEDSVVQSNHAGDGGLGGAGGPGVPGTTNGGTGGAGGSGGRGGPGGGLYNGSQLLVRSLINFNTSGNGGVGGAGGAGGFAFSLGYSGGNGGAGGSGGSAGNGGGAQIGKGSSLTNTTVYGNSAATAGAGGPGGPGGMASDPSLFGAPGAPGTSGFHGEGGGLYVSGDALMNFVTLTQNTAFVSAGVSNHATLQTRNSIFAHNIRFNLTNNNCEFANAATPFISAGNNLFGYGGNCALVASDIRVTDAGLQPLADNGGPTWSVAPLPDSPAVNAALCTAFDGQDVPLTDQRSSVRPSGAGCDIGAVELVQEQYVFIPLVRK